MSRLSDAIGIVEDFCLRHGIGRTETLRLTLTLEELFTNTVQHGHGGDCDARVRIELSVSSAEVVLLYEDEAPPFDALAHLAAQPPSLDAPLDARPVGGLGIHLVHQMASSVRYAREDGRNRLWLVFGRQA